MAEIKHVGRVKTTNKKCIVAYRTLPGEASSCLIVATENLPDAQHDALINLVESPAGQASYEFAEAMNRALFPDGSRMLPALHAQGRLLKVPTNQIEMTPNTLVRVLLSELNQIIAEQRGVTVDELSLRDTLGEKSTKPAEVAETPVAETAPAETPVAETSEVPETFEDADSEAKFYRSQADKLAKQAAEFRRKAEALVPTTKKKAE